MSVVRRVRLELPLLLPYPQKEEVDALPYADWLRTHAEEMMTLQNDDNEPLLKGIRSVTGIVEASIIIPVAPPKTAESVEVAAEVSEVLPALVEAIDSLSLPESVVTDVAEVPSMQIFVSDFCFVSEDALDYYNFNFLQVMKGRITESYPSAMDPGSPFKYRFGIRGIIDEEVFDALGTIKSDHIENVVNIGFIE